MSDQQREVITFILGAIVVIIAAYYTTRFIGKRSIKTPSGRNIRIRERFAVSKDKSFYLVEVKGKAYFLAITSRSITLLDTLEAEELDERTESSSAAAAGGSVSLTGLRGWLARFVAAMKINFSALVKTPSHRSEGLSFYDLEKRITLQSAKEEDNLDMVFREMQNSRVRRKTTASREDDDEET